MLQRSAGTPADATTRAATRSFGYTALSSRATCHDIVCVRRLHMIYAHVLPALRWCYQARAHIVRLQRTAAVPYVSSTVVVSSSLTRTCSTPSMGSDQQHWAMKSYADRPTRKHATSLRQQHADLQLAPHLLTCSHGHASVALNIKPSYIYIYIYASCCCPWPERMTTCKAPRAHTRALIHACSILQPPRNALAVPTSSCSCM